MPGKAEKRADPNETTGKKYTLEAFKSLYGAKQGQQQWKKAGGGAKAPAKKGKAQAQEDRRTDPTMPASKKTYTRKQFLEFYGDGAGAKLWKKAKPAGGAKQKQKGAATGAKPKTTPALVEAAVKAATGQPAKTVTIIAPLDEGMPGPEHFKITEAAVGEVPDGGVLMEVLAMSADPYLRGVIKRVPAGAPIPAFISGRVLASKSKKWAVGDLIGTNGPLTTVQVLTEKDLGGARKLNGMLTEAQISKGVGVLGMPGSTAYGGFIDVLRPEKRKKKGAEKEVVFVSAASGAVGQLVGQIAKIYGCITIGSAGGPEKCALIKEKFGYDHAIDYKAVKDAAELQQKLRECVGVEGTKDPLTGAETAPCIDMYFENVGGMHFEAALKSLKPGGRIAVCGCISSYNQSASDPALSQFALGSLIYPGLRIEGFVCTKWLTGAKGNFLGDMSRWLREGKVKTEETFTDGVENWPTAFQSLFKGTNVGKVVVRPNPDPLPLRQAREKKSGVAKE